MTALRRSIVACVTALAALVPLLATSASPATAQEQPSTTWLCRPGLPDNPCEPDLTTTVYDNTGNVVGVETPRPTRKADIDCFYVYPTTSNQPTPQASFAVDPELRSIALYQAARYSSECRVFAPVYRQITVPGLLAPTTVTPAMRETAYQDVRSAWLDYLENDNEGRGVVFIGHSQGTGVLRRLIREEVDPNPEMRDKLVSAILLGSNVTVRKGSDVGGDFQDIPACRQSKQTGCVIAFATFMGPVPDNSRFGRTSDPDLEVLCTNPTSLRGGTGSADVINPTEPFAPGTIIAGAISVLGLPPLTATTPWVEVEDAYAATCSSENGANVLQLTPQGTAPVIRPSPDPTWGLHLVDANIALGDLVDIVHRQAARWTKEHKHDDKQRGHERSVGGGNGRRGRG
jgi:hypothetical protein